MNVKYSTLVLCIAWLLFPEGTLSQTKAQSKDTAQYKTAELTVTSTRSAQTNLNAPLAITIVPQEQFKNNRGFGIDEALSFVPGVIVQSRSGNQDVRVVVRGFGARGAGQRSNAGTSRGVRFYQDGIPETEPDGRTAFDLIDMAGASSIEVIRSNASALWGNASGAVVNISTVPTEEKPFVNLFNTTGSFGYQKQTIQVGSPTSFGKFYTNVNNINFDGWRDHSGSSVFQFNSGLLSKLSESTQLNVLAVGASTLLRVPGPLTQAQYDSSAQQAQSLRDYEFESRDERRFNRLGRLGTTLSHAFNDNSSLNAMAFVQSKVLQRSERNTFRDFNRYHTGGNLVFKTKFNLSDDIKNTLLIGADNQYQDGAILFYDLLQGRRGDTLRTNKAEGANNVGAFIQDEIALSNNLLVTLGARYDRIDYYNQEYPTAVTFKTTVENKTFTRLTPKLGIVYRATPLVSIYANLGGGVEVPAGNEVDPPNTRGVPNPGVLVNSALNNPIASTTYELGSKGILVVDEGGLLKSINYDVAMYSVNVTNDLVPFQGGRFYMPAGNSTRNGVELGFQAQFSHGLSLLFSSTFSSNKYNDYIVDSIYTKSTLDSNLLGKTANYSGKELPGVPSASINARVRWVPEFLSQLFVEAEMRSVGSYYADDANATQVQAYSIFDAAIGIKQPIINTLTLNLLARMSNLADTKYMASAWLNPDSIGSPSAPAFIEAGLPRNYSLQVGLGYTF